MTQADNLSAAVSANTTAVANLASQFATLSQEVQQEIQQLVDAVEASGANSAAIDSAVAALTSTNQQLASLSTQATGLTSSLQADDPAAPPTP